jgi:hypothetical protein
MTRAADRCSWLDRFRLGHGLPTSGFHPGSCRHGHGKRRSRNRTSRSSSSLAHITAYSASALRLAVTHAFQQAWIRHAERQHRRSCARSSRRITSRRAWRSRSICRTQLQMTRSIQEAQPAVIVVKICLVTFVKIVQTDQSPSEVMPRSASNPKTEGNVSDRGSVVSCAPRPAGTSKTKETCLVILE